MLTQEFSNFTKKFCTSDIESLKRGAESYVNATRKGSLCCIVKSVSKSGLSRKLKFVSVDQYGSDYSAPYYYHYFFELLGYKSNLNNTITVNGPGMDMIFYTHYRVINMLCDFGFITESEREVLIQKTPHTL